MAEIEQKAISITFSPRELKSHQIENFKKWLTGMGGDPSENSKIMGLEKQGQLHIQAGILTNTRSDNLRRNLKKILDFDSLDDDERKFSLKLKTHNNWKYLVGYCNKEGKLQYHNFDEETLADYIEYYETTVDSQTKVKEEQNWICSGLNSLLASTWNYCIEENINPKLSLRYLVVEMVAHNRIPFSLGRKIKRSDEIFWKAYTEVKSTGDLQREYIEMMIVDDDIVEDTRTCLRCRTR